MLPSTSKTKMSSGLHQRLVGAAAGAEQQHAIGAGHAHGDMPEHPIVPCRLSMRVSIAVLRRSVASSSIGDLISPLWKQQLTCPPDTVTLQTRHRSVREPHPIRIAAGPGRISLGAHFLWLRFEFLC